jgi:3-phenylpropionate/trans-cinnamate dioxygenase ferredoxin reductase component
MAIAAHHLIVGASAAGVAAAFAMRRSGFEGHVTIVEAGTELPYERPPLSKAVGAGEIAFLRPIKRAGEYGAAAIDLRLGTRADRLDPAGRTVWLSDGSAMRADRVLLAPGVSARQLVLPGSDLGNVMTLRDADDARRLAAAISAGGPMVLIGGGFIGMEVAAAARAAGCAVTVVEMAALPLLPALGHPLAELITALHRDEGVRVLTRTSAEAFRGHGAVSEVLLSTGDRLPAAVVVVGVGVVPNDGLAVAAGVRCDGGIVVDRHCRTSDPWILAAGDVTVQPHPHLKTAGRIEHWDNALEQGEVAGAVMAGDMRVHDAVPYFWSEQYGLTLQLVGRPHAGDQVLLRPDASPRRFVALWLRGDAVVAAAGLDAARDVAAAKRLVERRTPVSASNLLDPAADLRALARS